MGQAVIAASVYQPLKPSPLCSHNPLTDPLQWLHLSQSEEWLISKATHNWAQT